MTLARAIVLAVLTLAAVMLIALLMPAVSTKAEEAWEATLRLQLVEEKRCDLKAYVSVRQQPGELLGGIEGRVRCADGREFDFTRQKAHQKFDIRLCQPAVC